MTKLSDNHHLVVFFDIYGFSNLIKDGLIEKHLSNLLEIGKWINKEVQGINAKVYLFSDCGFIIQKIKKGFESDNIAEFVGLLERLQDVYLDTGYLIRGAVSCGEIAMSENIIIGEAIIEAVKYESQYCPGPFIIFPLDKIKNIVKEDSLLSVLKIKAIKFKKESGKLYCSVIFPMQKRKYLKYIQEKKEYHLLKGPPNYGIFWDNTYELITNDFIEYFGE